MGLCGAVAGERRKDCAVLVSSWVCSAKESAGAQTREQKPINGRGTGRVKRRAGDRCRDWEVGEAEGIAQSLCTLGLAGLL